MPYPPPQPGLVIRYAYLWQHEKLLGCEEGSKDRPCAVVLVTRMMNDIERVVVLPITHTPPSDASLVMEIPRSTKQRLGLDEKRSWIVLNELNRFTWPGPDLRPSKPGDLSSVAYGFLPKHMLSKIRERVLAILESGRDDIVSRSE